MNTLEIVWYFSITQYFSKIRVKINIRNYEASWGHFGFSLTPQNRVGSSYSISIYFLMVGETGLHVPFISIFYLN